METPANQPGDRTGELMVDRGLSWRMAWRQAESEFGSAPPQHPRPSDRPVLTFPVWPFVMLGVSILTVFVSFVVLGFMSIQLAGYGVPPSGGEAQFMDLMEVVFYVSWVGIPVSFASIARRSARTENSAAAAWIAVVVWVALSVWAIIGLSSL
jgi:hypothetical protein